MLDPLSRQTMIQAVLAGRVFVLETKLLSDGNQHWFIGCSFDLPDGFPYEFCFSLAELERVVFLAVVEMNCGSF